MALCDRDGESPVRRPAWRQSYLQNDAKSKCRSVRSPRAVVTCSAAPGGHALPIPPGATLSKAKERVSSRFVRFGKTRCERPRLARL